MDFIEELKRVLCNCSNDVRKYLSGDKADYVYCAQHTEEQGRASGASFSFVWLLMYSNKSIKNASLFRTIFDKFCKFFKKYVYITPNRRKITLKLREHCLYTLYPDYAIILYTRKGES